MHRAGLRHDGRFSKSARVVGDVMGKYHPHGDTAIYDALVRMAQPFTLRLPLVEGQGNFGSPDGDAPAAMRYTECKLSRAAAELLSELDRDTVDFRPNYDEEEQEPVVLPARFPNLLVNGSSGIAVGMASSIPPHNFGEVIDAAVALIDDPGASIKALLKHIKGPDFPTGGQLVCSRKELEEVYSAGQGSLKLRGTWKIEEPARGSPRIVITSIPYAVERKTIVEKIAEVIIAKKLPHLLDVRDESTDETRIVLEVKKGADPQLIMAYLYRHTPLATHVQVNFTCLVPVPSGGTNVPAPARLDLRQILRHFLDFRMQVVVRRLAFDLAQIRRRIHILEGFVAIFDALDETIRIIRKSQGRQDAAETLRKRFDLSQEQVDAILELRLYRLAQLEIQIVRRELDEKRREETRLSQLLSSEGARWKLIRAELLELKDLYGAQGRGMGRVTKIVGDANEPEYDAEAFIIEEDAFVLLSRQGWVKRQGSVRDLASTRTREGDAILDVVAGSTKTSVAFFSNRGVCYVCRVVDIPATTGYGVPVQTLFKLGDGERIVKMLGFDPRVLDVPPEVENATEPQPPFALAVTKGGFFLRFSLRAHREPSTRAGRKYVRLHDDFPKGGDEVVFVGVCAGDEKLAVATAKGRALVCMAHEAPILAGAGKGVRLIKLEDEDDAVLGARLMRDSTTPLVIEHENGKTFEVTVWKEVVARGSRGTPLFKKGRAVRALAQEPEIPVLPTALGALAPKGGEA
jgi:DNA gyrase subunit A